MAEFDPQKKEVAPLINTIMTVNFMVKSHSGDMNFKKNYIFSREKQLLEY